MSQGVSLTKRGIFLEARKSGINVVNKQESMYVFLFNEERRGGSIILIIFSNFKIMDCLNTGDRKEH